MPDDDSPEAQDARRAELERRVRAGEWLSPGLVAILLGLSRSTINNRLAAREIGFRPHGKLRVCKPEDVLRELEAGRQETPRAGLTPPESDPSPDA